VVSQDLSVSTLQSGHGVQALVASEAGATAPSKGEGAANAAAVQGAGTLEGEAISSPGKPILKDAGHTTQIQDIANSIKWNAANNSPDFIAKNFVEACTLRAAHGVVVTGAIVQAYEKVGGVSSLAVSSSIQNDVCAAVGYCGVARMLCCFIWPTFNSVTPLNYRTVVEGCCL
jgi:hypothetical protein